MKNSWTTTSPTTSATILSTSFGGRRAEIWRALSSPSRPASRDGDSDHGRLVPRRRWHDVVHPQTAVMLRRTFRPGIVITSVPYRVGRGGEKECTRSS